MKNDTQWSSQVSGNRAATVPGSAVDLGHGVCALLTTIQFLEVGGQSSISGQASLSALHQLNDLFRDEAHTLKSSQNQDCIILVQWCYSTSWFRVHLHIMKNPGGGMV